MRNDLLVRDLPRHNQGPRRGPTLGCPPSSNRKVRRAELEDVLRDIPERKDLQQLYERKVPIDQLVRLLGHRVDRGRIGDILNCDDPKREIRRILGSE